MSLSMDLRILISYKFHFITDIIITKTEMLIEKNTQLYAQAESLS